MTAAALFDYVPFAFVALMVAVTVGLGAWATRRASTASDFFVAGRGVSAGLNAAAISGEYLSAASFLGVAGLVMRFGYDPLWYPACYAAGYLFLLLFIAGPLRRFGAYTIPDFAEGRFDSPGFRKIAVTFVLFIGFFYTMPQMNGAGITMQQVLGWPYWAGVAGVGGVITFNVATGGMKGITFVQAFQYWAKLFAISAPLFVVALVSGGYPAAMNRVALTGENPAVFQSDTSLRIPGPEKAPANTLAVYYRAGIRFPEGADLESVPGHGFLVSGWPDAKDATYYDNGSTSDTLFKSVHLVKGGSLNISTMDWRVPRKVVFKNAAKADFLAGTEVPNSQSGKTWLSPFGPFTAKYGHPLLYTYSLIIALVCGTAGLPHILVRFYTNPDGKSAKRTTFWVMVLIGTFYMFTPAWGALGRTNMPELYTLSQTNRVVVKLPLTLKEHPLLGQVLSGIAAAGAFAAFMSTFSGLLVSMSGAFAHDIYGRILRPGASAASRMTAFKLAAVGVGAASVGLGMLVESFDIAMMVGWAFAIGASSYFPLLLMGAWWRGLTMPGAAAGMLAGGVTSMAAIVTHMLIEKGVVTTKFDGVTRTLMEQPAVFGVPLALLTMVVVSKATARQVPADIDLKMLRLHAPEEMGLSRNYIEG